MTEEKIQMFMMSKQKCFETTQVPLITERLKTVGDDKLTLISSADYKDPTVMLIISLFLGTLGVDRFMLGDIKMGVIKLLTFGGCGVLTIIDWLHVMEKTRQKNLETFIYSMCSDCLEIFSSDDTKNAGNTLCIAEYFCEI